MVCRGGSVVIINGVRPLAGGGAKRRPDSAGASNLTDARPRGGPGLPVPRPMARGSRAPPMAEAQGFGRILAWAGDLYPWQVAAVFYSKGFAADRARAVAFMKGYVRASRYYSDAALTQKEGRPAPGANYDEVVQITARYTGARPEIIKIGFPFQDR